MSHTEAPARCAPVGRWCNSTCAAHQTTRRPGTCAGTWPAASSLPHGRRGQARCPDARMLQNLLRTARDDALPWFWRSVCLEHATLPLARPGGAARSHRHAWHRSRRERGREVASTSMKQRTGPSSWPCFSAPASARCTPMFAWRPWATRMFGFWFRTAPWSALRATRITASPPRNAAFGADAHMSGASHCRAGLHRIRNENASRFEHHHGYHG